MRKLRSLETSESDYPVTRRHIRHEINPQTRRCEGWKIAGKIILRRIHSYFSLLYCGYDIKPFFLRFILVYWSLKNLFLGVNNYPTRCNNTQCIYICKLLYMFRVVPPPIIRSSYHCTYSSHPVTFTTVRSNSFKNAIH